MCPDRTYTDAKFGSGAPWLAVPKSSNLYDKASEEFVMELRSSEFATRGQCRECGSKTTMQYDCELFTTWICMDRFDIGIERIVEAVVKNKAHIHVPTVPEGEEDVDEDGIPAFHSWEPWLPDPCRPDDSENPSVCLSCFHLEGADYSSSSNCGPSGCKYEVVPWERLKDHFLGSTST